MEFDTFKTPKGRYVTYLWTWPQDLIMWLLWILPFWALWGEKLRWEEGCLAFNLKEDSWPAKTWYSKWGGTSIGHAIMFNYRVVNTPESLNTPAQLHRITVHEHFHVRQFESISFTAFITSFIPFAVLGSLGHFKAAVLTMLAMWILGHTFYALGNFTVAALLGKRAYRDSIHEQAAYAVDYKYTQTGKRDT